MLIKKIFFVFIFLTSCIDKSHPYQKYLERTHDYQQYSLIITKVYNRSIGVAPPKNPLHASLNFLLDFVTTRHLHYTNLEIGAEIELGAEGCQANNKRYILGKKLDNIAITAINPKENYQYKPEYQVTYLKPGKYQICSLRQYRFTEYNQEHEFEEFDVSNGQWFDIAPNEPHYLGDIYINSGKYELIDNNAEFCQFVQAKYPKLRYKLCKDFA